MPVALAELCFRLVLHIVVGRVGITLRNGVAIYLHILHGISVVGSQVFLIGIPFVGIVYATGPGLWQSLSVILAIPAGKILIAVAGEGGHHLAIVGNFGGAVAAAVLVVILPAQAHLVGIRHYGKCTQLPFGFKGIDHALVLEVAIGAAAGVHLAKVALLFVLFQLQVYGLYFLSVVNAGKFGLIAFFVKYLHLVHGISLQALGHHLRVVAEELFTVHQYLGHGLALCGYLSVLIYLYAGQFFQQVFHGCVFPGLKAVGHIFGSVALYFYGSILFGEHKLLQKVFFRHHWNDGEISNGIFHSYLVNIVGK